MSITDSKSPSHEQADQIMAQLPLPDYTANFQPEFEPGSQHDAIAEMTQTKPVTTPENIVRLRADFTRIALGVDERPIVFTGNCAEPVDLSVSIDELVEQAQVRVETVQDSKLKNPLIVLRNRGQNTKPRSNEFETAPNGDLVVSYMGDAVNQQDIAHRDPDASRMVAAAIQARDLEEGLTESLGYHVPAAHEALLLAYDRSFLQTDPETDMSFLLSADLPWIGVRTNDADGEHAQMLSDVENSVGVKLSAATSPEHITRLQQVLNPNRSPGKMLYMLRFGLGGLDKAPRILEAIQENDPHGLIIYDLHGNTRTLEDGTKLRVVGDIVDEIQLLAGACKSIGLKLHGLHLETTHDDERLECVDSADQRPTHPGNIDPQLNPRQTKLVLNAVAEHLL